MQLRMQGKVSFTKPLAISLLLHACVLGAIYYSTVTLKPQVIEPQLPPTIEITLVERNPQAIEVVDVEPEIETTPDEIVSIDAPLTSDTDLETISGLLPEQSEEEMPLAPDIASSVPESDPVRPLLEPGDTVESSYDVPGIDAAGISSALSKYMKTYQNDLSEDWISDCIRYQSRHGTNDCPQNQGENDIRAVYRDYDSNRSSDIIARSETLTALINDENLTGEDLLAIHQIQQNYVFLVTPTEKWVPQKGADKFNPNLVGPQLDLLGAIIVPMLTAMGYISTNKLGPIRLPKDQNGLVDESGEEEDYNEFRVFSPLYSNKP